MRAGVLVLNGQGVPRRQVDDSPCAYDDRVSEDDDRWLLRKCMAVEETLGSHRYTAIYDRREGSRDFPPTKVPPGHVFVLGDNRDSSHDSRAFGSVPSELVRGKVFALWWSTGAGGIRTDRLGLAIE